MMKRLLIALAVLAVWTLPVSSTPVQEPEAAQDSATEVPKAVFEVEQISFGELARGEVRSAEFVLRNEGGAELLLLRQVAGPGLAVEEFDRVLEPGAKRTLRVTWDSINANGPTVTPLVLVTNDPSRAQIELTVAADVVTYIGADPGFARYKVVELFEREGLVAQTLWPLDGGDLEIERIESTLPFLEVRFREAKESEWFEHGKGRQWRVETVLPPDAPIGMLQGRVLIHTKHAHQKLVSIPVSGFVRPLFAVTPHIADFGSISVTRPIQYGLHVKSFDTKPIEVTGVESDIEGLDAEITRAKGRDSWLRLTLHPTVAKGPLRGKIKIRTASEKKPVVEVPVQGTVL